MTYTPRLSVVCGRCGHTRGITHLCLSGGKRKATVKPKFSFGKCERCRKTQGNPITHVCHPRSDFKARKRKAAKQEQAAVRKKQKAGKHDYQSCRDKECERPLCVAFKTGWRRGYMQGQQDGYETGYAVGFPDGLRSCPGPHTG